MKIIILLNFLIGASALANATDCVADGEKLFIIDTRETKTSDKTMKFFYGTAFAVKKDKPIILVIPGGPGGTLQDVLDVVTNPKVKPIFESLGNIVSFDHRGIGCTKKINPQLPAFRADLWSLANAAADLDVLRQDFIKRFGFSSDQKILVLGFSYGGILGQQFVLDYQEHIAKAVLGATIYKASQFQLARDQFLNLMINYDEALKAKLESVQAKFPGSKNRILRAVFSYGYSLKSRTVDFPQYLDLLLSSNSQADFDQLIYSKEEWYLKEEIASGLVPCASIWDYPQEQEANNYFFSGWYQRCASYRGLGTPFDFSARLKEIKIPLLLMSGAKDHVTPTSAIQEMAALIPGSLLWVNEQSGHIIRDEKPECFVSLLFMFYGGKSDADIKAFIQSPACQAPPKM